MFEHYAYATGAQVRFKERYYGYRGAVDAWRRLQQQQQQPQSPTLPCRLREFLPWVSDDTMADRADKIVPNRLVRLS